MKSENPKTNPKQMKHIFKYILGLTIALAMFSCQEDPMKEIADGNWNKERNILSVKLQNQFGPGEIVRDEFETSVTVSVNKVGLDLSAVKIDEIVLSYGASSSVTVGGTLNFDNADNKAELTVIAASGEELTWTIVVQPYDMFYVGNWSFTEQRIYVNQEWGSKFDRPIQDNFPNAALELDNSVTIAYKGYENGRTFGTINNAAGSDGEYGVFANDNVDISSKIRHLIPKGESTWQMDLATNTMYITKDGKTATAIVTKDGSTMKFVYELPFKPEEPYWDYGDHDNFLSWSYQYDITFSTAK